MLEGPGHTCFHQFVNGRFSDIFSIEDHLAGIGSVNAGNHVEQRGFPGPVWTDQSAYNAFFNGETDLVLGLDAAEHFGQIPHLKDLFSPDPRRLL